MVVTECWSGGEKPFPLFMFGVVGLNVFVPSLSETLSTTTPVSPLLRKARRLGVCGLEEIIALAVARGCKHYARAQAAIDDGECFQEISDAELTILLLIGENPYDPHAIRCAGQMARSPNVNAARLAKLAIMEKCERVLAHIARAGVTHDADGHGFWQELLNALPLMPEAPEPDLPHWTRFVSMPGIQRSEMVSPRWLTPQSS